MTSMIVGSITLLIEAESKAIWISYPSHQAFITCFRLKESLTDIFEIGHTRLTRVVSFSIRMLFILMTTAMRVMSVLT